MSEVPAVEERGIVDCLLTPRKAKLLQRVTIRPRPRPAGAIEYTGRAADISPLRTRPPVPPAAAPMPKAATRPPRPSAASNSRRPIVTVMRPSRARCVKARIPRHERAVLTARHPARARRGHRPQRIAARAMLRLAFKVARPASPTQELGWRASGWRGRFDS